VRRRLCTAAAAASTGVGPTAAVAAAASFQVTSSIKVHRELAA